MLNRSILLLLLIGGAAGAWAEPGTPRSARSVTIGLIGDFSGPARYWSEPGLAGARVAVDQLHREGIEARLVVEDSALNPKSGLAAAQKLLALDEVDALLVEYTPVVGSVSPLAASARKLMLGSCGVKSFLENNPYAFKSFLDYEEGCRSAAAHWKRKGLQKVAVLHVPFESGDLCLKGTRTVYPEAAEVSYRMGEPLSSQALLMKKKGIEGVVQVGFEADGRNLGIALRELSFRPKVALAEVDFEPEKNIRDFLDVYEGLITFGFPALSEEFTKKLLGVNPRMTEVGRQNAGIEYTHVLQLARAAAGCPVRDIACEVRQMALSTADPAISFERFKNRVAEFRLVLKEWRGGNASEL